MFHESYNVFLQGDPPNGPKNEKNEPCAHETVSQLPFLSFRPKGEILMFNDMNELRFLTCVRNDSYSYCYTVSHGVGLFDERPLRVRGGHHFFGSSSSSSLPNWQLLLSHVGTPSLGSINSCKTIQNTTIKTIHKIPILHSLNKDPITRHITGNYKSLCTSYTGEKLENAADQKN